MKSQLSGKVVGTASITLIEYDAVLLAVDDLIHPPKTEEFVAPGLIDLQVNGFAGVDFNEPTASHEAILGSIHAMFKTGVTRIFPTVITGSEERMTGSLANLTAAKREFAQNGMPEANAIEAFHVEGPHISPEDGPRGAHPAEHVRPPDVEEFKRWQEAADGQIRLVTISPEWSGTPAYIENLIRSGVVASIGHTAASRDQISAAVDAGASMSTHLGNGAHPVLNKTRNYIWDQLAEDRLAPSFIVDGVHLPQSFYRAALRAKGVERAVLVTDAVMPAMCAPGPYTLGQVQVELKTDGSVVMRGTSRLAGSALRMDCAVGNSVRFGGTSLREAIAMASTNPARVGRVAGRQRGLAPGEKADLIRFRWNETAHKMTVVETVLAGVRVFEA